MERHPKFVIVGDNLYMGKVVYHKELINTGDVVLGGGYFLYNDKDDSFTFYGDSHDFGRATEEQVRNAVEKGNVGERCRPQRYAQHNLYYTYDIGLMSERVKLNNRNRNPKR